MSRWIDADALIEAMGEEPYVWTDSDDEIAERNQWLTDMHIIESAPSIDIVRCGECKNHKPSKIWAEIKPCIAKSFPSIRCKMLDREVDADDFCSYGVRKTNTTAEEKPTPIRDYMVHGEREGE